VRLQVGAMRSRRSKFYRRRPHRMPKPINGKAGFSLIEVLAALLVTMLLVLTLSPFVIQMLATWSRGGEVVRLVEFQTRGLGRLRQDLRHALVFTGYGQTQDLAAFEGDETSMSFPVVAGVGPDHPGLEYLLFTVATTIDGRALVRRRAPVIGSSYGSFVDPVVLISGPFRYVFKYYSRDGEELASWSKSQFDLPAHVELHILDRNGLPLFGGPIAISTFASLSAGCFAGANLRGCSTSQMPDTAGAHQELLKELGVLPEPQG
jgi:general secretion pathway protein J